MSRLTILERPGAVTGVCLMVAAEAAAGPCWCEMVDAGSLPAAAQVPEGTGPLGCIIGTLTGKTPQDGDFEDLFLICICEPEAFQASVTFPAQSDFNPQLFLFRPGDEGEAFGMLANDDVSIDDASSILLPMPTDGSPPLTKPGNYYLAISGFDNDPASKGGDIFLEADFVEISGPDGPGGAQPLIGWDPGFGGDGDYTIQLSGVTFPDHCVCTGNTNGDDEVDVVDMINVILCWETEGHDCPEDGERTDVNGDHCVDVQDLVLVVLNFGLCSVGECPDGGDGAGDGI